MAGPWKKNLLEALSREHRCEPPRVVQPPYGHQCAVCGQTVSKGHPLHRARRPNPSEEAAPIPWLTLPWNDAKKT
jgi:hypothetical protein